MLLTPSCACVSLFSRPRGHLHLSLYEKGTGCKGAPQRPGATEPTESPGCLWPESVPDTWQTPPCMRPGDGLSGQPTTESESL